MATVTTTCTRSFLIVGLLTAHEPDHGYQLGARITTGVVWSAGLPLGRAKPATGIWAAYGGIPRAGPRRCDAGRGLRLGIIGLVLGLPISVVTIAFVSRPSPGTVDTSPSLALVGGIIAGVVIVVASVATLIPATRAARVNPVTVLRSD